jgi:hypothetical protein
MNQVQNFRELTPLELLSVNGGAGTPNPGMLISQLVSDLSTTVNDALNNLGIGSLLGGSGSGGGLGLGNLLGGGL